MTSGPRSHPPRSHLRWPRLHVLWHFRAHEVPAAGCRLRGEYRDPRGRARCRGRARLDPPLQGEQWRGVSTRPSARARHRRSRPRRHAPARRCPADVAVRAGTARPLRESGADQCPRRLGEEGLSSVAHGTNASRTYDVETDVSLLVYRGLAGVQSHAHADGLPAGPVRRRVCTLCFDRSCNGVSRAREGEEECVSLGIDLDAVVATERATNDSSVRGQDFGISVAEPLEQLRRVLDVGKDKRHRSGRQRRHAAIVLRGLPFDAHRLDHASRTSSGALVIARRVLRRVQGWVGRFRPAARQAGEARRRRARNARSRLAVASTRGS